MRRDFSLYMDVIRFFAAMVVFLSHSSSQSLTGGLFWQFKDYAQTAVIVFFVLSGYVIAFVVEGKETNLKSYSFARIARLYSILLPALVLTAVLDLAGIYLNPEFDPLLTASYLNLSQFENYILSFFMLNNIWGLQQPPGINGPFWSLSYEVFYYVIFGIVFFVKKTYKWTLAITACILAGPSILILFPTWLFGYFVYKMHQRFKAPRSKLKAGISVVAIGFIIAFAPDLRSIPTSLPFIEREELAGDYFDAVLFSIHLYYAPHLTSFFNFSSERTVKVIRLLGSVTFSMYLFHRPIIQFLAVAFKDSMDSVYYHIMFYSISFFLIFLLSHLFEDKKTIIKKYLNNRF